MIVVILFPEISKKGTDAENSDEEQPAGNFNTPTANGINPSHLPPNDVSLPLSTNKPASYTNSRARVSLLQCNSHEGPLKSPVLAYTPGTQNPQVPTPPPHAHISTSLIDPSLGSSIQSTLSGVGKNSTLAIMTPTEMGLPNFPQPPEDIMARNYNTNAHENYAIAISPRCSNTALHDFNSSSVSSATMIPSLYAFGDELMPAALTACPSSSYSMAPTTENSFNELSPTTITIMTHSKSFTPERVFSCPASVSPTESPVANSDCSLATSPLTLNMSLVAPKTPEDGRNFPPGSSESQPDILGLQDEDSSLIPNIELSPSDVSSPIHTTEPVALADILSKEWDLFSSTLRPVVQTSHDTWTADSPQMLSGSCESASSPRTSEAQLSHQYSSAYCSQYSSDPKSSNQHYCMNSMSGQVN